MDAEGLEVGEAAGWLVVKPARNVDRIRPSFRRGGVSAPLGAKQGLSIKGGVRHYFVPKIQDPLGIRAVHYTPGP